MFGLPSDENQPEQTIRHPCKLREGRDGLASSFLVAPGVGYGSGAGSPDKEGGSRCCWGRGCSREWEWESRWSSVVVSCRVSCAVLLVRVWGLGEKRSGRVEGMEKWGNGHAGTHRNAGTRAKSWPLEKTSLAQSHNCNCLCLQAQPKRCVYRGTYMAAGQADGSRRRHTEAGPQG